MEFKINTMMCTMTDPFNIPYDCYKTGDLTIGGFATQFDFLSENISFLEPPKIMSVDELM